MLVLLSLFPAFVSVAMAQEADTAEAVSGRIVGKVWHTRVRMEDSFQYLNSVRESLGIAASPVMMMTGRVNMGPGRVRLEGEAQPELKGTLFFLQIRPEVSLNNPISFELVGTQERFQELVTQQKDMMGPAAELTGQDDRFEIRLDFQKLMAGFPQPAEPAEGDEKPEEGKQVTRSFSIVVAADVSSGAGGGGEAGAAPRMPAASSTYFRYVDGIMYSSRSKALMTIDLPARDTLHLSDEDSGHDLYADFDLTQVPSEMKQAFWSALETQASVFLQRFDDEAAGEYSLRRVLAEGRLELLKRALFDVDRVRFSLNLSPETGKPIVSRLRVSARENSTLATVLGSLSGQGTQLTSLRDESAPLVLSSTIVVPEFVRPFATAFLNSVNLRLKEAAGETPGADILIDDLISPLQDSVDHGIIDAALCFKGTVKTGLIPCGAIRLESAEKFMSVLESVIQVTSLRDHVSVTTGTSGDYRTLSLRVRPQKIPLSQSEVPLHLHLAATGSWLWFTLGDERGSRMLDELVSTNEESLSRSGEATPLLVRLRLSEWLGETDDEVSRIPSQWLETLERFLKKTTAPKMSISVNGQNMTQKSDDADAFQSYAARALKPEDSDLQLRVRSADQELVVDAEVGAGLARFAVAQFLDSQSRMFSGLNMQFQVPQDGKGQVRRFGTLNFGTRPPENKQP